MERSFKQFDKVALLALARNMDDKTLLTFCKTDKYFNSKICNNDSFWENRINEKYPFLVSFKTKEETWKNFYLEMIFYINKLKEEFGIPYIPTKDYNPRRFYYENKYRGDIYNSAVYWAAEGGNMEIVNLMIEKSATDFDGVMIQGSFYENIDYLKNITKNN